MRLAKHEKDLCENIQRARSEALKSFGSGELILEKAVINPRHIEIQIFSDSQGNTIYLGERDCSIQRRHQKVVEEAPSPFVDELLRAEMGEAAVKAANSVGYEGAGTVEFLVDSDKNFYFLEMNTRLQVEHPVTEMITGLDLVELQIDIAAGSMLPLNQPEVTFQGHAIEVRLYAEDPSNSFLPQTGKVECWEPPKGEGIRVDHGLKQGDIVSSYYDPMLAKVISYGKDRGEACRKLKRALEGMHILGVTTNQFFLRSILSNSKFLKGQVNTSFIEDQYPQGFPSLENRLFDVGFYLGLAGSFLHYEEGKKYGVHARYGWSNGLGISSHYKIKIFEQDVLVQVFYDLNQMCYMFSGDWGGENYSGKLHLEIDGEEKQGFYRANDDGKSKAFAWIESALFLETSEGILKIEDLSREASRAKDAAASGRILAMMEGTLTALKVKEGEVVVSGQAIAVLEAMKMEHTLKSEVDGVVQSIAAQEGEQVKGKQLLVEIRPRSQEEVSF